jgi:hypothetical protein
MVFPSRAVRIMIVLRNFPQEPLRKPPNMRKSRSHQTLFAHFAQFLTIS